MAEFNIKNQRADQIFQGEQLFINSEQSSEAAARLDALLARIDAEGTGSDEWTLLRAEVEGARGTLPEPVSTVGALERARAIALGLRATSVVAAVTSVIATLTQ